MRKVTAVILLGLVGYYLFSYFIQIPFGEDRSSVGDYYLNNTVEQTGSVNTVTSIIVSYRGFDTLGEVTVLFLAATGLGAILFDKKGKKRRRQNASLIVRVSAQLIYPFIILLGAYVFIHGHLTPGGGFQGGAIIATGVLLMFMSYRSFDVNHKALTYMESLAGITFVVIGLAGLIWGGSFLQNFLPLGMPNELFSAGVIPIIYIAVGIKVGAELTGLLDNLLKTIK
ncbi:MAG: Na(+)/H(+) antiporter subunit B [Melioribacteraceae bacterium]|nr:Na(+)/H(+) antiporter subunit B [Melioribacteraceae bacterium]